MMFQKCFSGFSLQICEYFQIINMKRQKRSPIPERTESEMVHFAQALPGINVKL